MITINLVKLLEQGLLALACLVLLALVLGMVYELCKPRDM